jgi:hypothetical protein
MSATRNENTGEAEAGMFQPDTLLPAQFFARLRGRAYVEGEKRLMAAILTDAVECYMKQMNATEGRGRQLFLEAEEWVFGDSGGWVFSFENICDLLGLEPEYIRRGLLNWRQKRTATLRSLAVYRERRAPSGAAEPVVRRKAS